MNLSHQDALQLSHTLTASLRQRIVQAGGWLSFADYMGHVLYAPGLGYYSAGAHKLGAAGDFTTAPEMTYLFGLTLARQIAEILPHLSTPVLYEFGAGSGRLAVDILRALEKLGQKPDRYYIIDVSADFVARQQRLFAQALPHFLTKIEWLTTLPPHLNGILIANEVLDAMPCELIHWAPRPLWRGVALKQEHFIWQDRPLTDRTLLTLAHALAIESEDYVTEINLNHRAFIRTLAERLEQGVMMLIDYGFKQTEYYHPQRTRGTLIGHYRHQIIDDPFYLPGLVDLSCHVDFSAIAQAAVAAGLDLVGYTSQAQFLMNAGLLDELQQLDPNDVETWLPQASAVQKLLSAAEMGELFKVMGLSKNITLSWSGFAHNNRSDTL